MAATQKIVSLCPSLTETLIDFGLVDALRGITKFCIHPKAIVSRLHVVGGTKDPNIDEIRRLGPDLIFMNAEENRREDYEALAADFDVDVSEPRCVADIPALLRHFGERTQTQAHAEQRALELEGELDLLKADVMKHQTHFSYGYFIWRKPWMVVGSDTYVSDLIALAGGRNIFADHRARYPSLALQEAHSLQPDYVFLADEPFPFEQTHLREVGQQLSQADVRLISGDDCCWHGVRTIRGVRLMRTFVQELAELDT